MADPIIFPIPNPENPKEHNNLWFEWREEKDEAGSETAGHPVFDAVVVAHIMGPGTQRSEATHVVLRRKNDGKETRNDRGLGQFLDAFLKNDAGNLAGTPLSELGALDAGLIATLRAIGVHNVEGLAAINETAQGQFMGFRKYKTMAQAFIDQRAGLAPMNKMAAEVDSLKTQLETLQANYDDLVSRLPKEKKKAA